MCHSQSAHYSPVHNLPIRVHLFRSLTLGISQKKLLNMGALLVPLTCKLFPSMLLGPSTHYGYATETISKKHKKTKNTKSVDQELLKTSAAK